MTFLINLIKAIAVPLLQWLLEKGYKLIEKAIQMKKIEKKTEEAIENENSGDLDDLINTK